MTWYLFGTVVVFRFKNAKSTHSGLQCNIGHSIVLFLKQKKNATKPTANLRSSNYLFHTLTSSEYRKCILFLIFSVQFSLSCDHSSLMIHRKEAGVQLRTQAIL